MQIDEGIGNVKDRSENATQQIKNLNQRLEELKKKNASNKFNIDNAKSEAERASEQADKANKVSLVCWMNQLINMVHIEQLFDELEKKYLAAQGKLDQKSKVSDKLKSRANSLKNNASKLLSDVTAKLQKIKGNPF